MNEQEFQVNYLEKVKETLSFVLDNPYSDFYRKKYKGLNIAADSISTLADFKKIPYLTKEEILAIPLEDRYFVPKEEVTTYSVSSGTTNINKPLILPRISEGKFEYSQNSALKKSKVERVLLLLPPSLTLVKARKIKLPYISVDYQKPGLSAKIAKEYQPDGIISTPTILYLLVPYLQKENFDFNKIKHITIGNEFITEAKAAYFKEKFPNALLRFTYGSSEIGGIVGYRCDFIHDLKPNVYHLRNDINLMEVDCKRGDEQGELICTSLERKAFPLIRYKTGDVGKIEHYKCECGQEHLLTLFGRTELDVLKVSGALLHTQMLESAISILSEILSLKFQAHVFEKKIKNQILTEIILKVVPTRNLAGEEKKIAKIIQDHLYLASDKTLTDYVNEGIFLPLKVELVSAIESNGKSKNIISHLK